MLGSITGLLDTVDLDKPSTTTCGNGFKSGSEGTILGCIDADDCFLGARVQLLFPNPNP